MIIRATPQNPDNYIGVSDEVSIILHRNGFIPKYIDKEKIYYFKTQKLIEYMEKEGLHCL